ncbi:HK97-gp10 family putative phage morphogenesis protein [Amycolatopsis palatopharyngis]|uniref:HK97-gp10 family putative phage morphogenesis protein n=1 Tax=Amycolatopsis palatopharyngis TaxID=187982 RepID=UPI000E22A8DE|nr:HK97-gp10 family putative phage morphogenesis protein [Amycolatopsis palatopharyngis]
MAKGAHLNGGKELAAALKNLQDAVDTVGVEALKEWSSDVESEAKRDVVIDSGNLGSAIESKVDASRLKAEVGVFEDDAYYGTFIEHGTSSIEAQPFLLPAFERHRDIKPYIQTALERYL